MQYKNPLEQLAGSVVDSILNQKRATGGSMSLSSAIAETKQRENLSDDALHTLIPLVNKAYLIQTNADEFDRATPTTVAQILYKDISKTASDTYHYKEYQPRELNQYSTKAASDNVPQKEDIKLNIQPILLNQTYEEQWHAKNEMLRYKAASDSLFKEASDIINTLKMYGVDSNFISNVVWEKDMEARDLQKVACALFNKSVNVKAASTATSSQLENLSNNLYETLSNFMDSYDNFKHASAVYEGRHKIYSTIRTKGEVMIDA
jgi:Holliday junction resolvase RusA-like endonuclease